MSGMVFLDRLLDIVSRHRRIIVIGRTDTGKSTLVRNLADHMDALVLDADIGQNDIGPPSAVWLGERREGCYHAIDVYFCGSTTPSRHFIQMIAGLTRMLQSCNNRHVLINTTGLATGEVGRALKTEKINAAKPDLIIGIEAGNELQYLDAFSCSGIDVIKFPPHPQVTSRIRTERERLRSEMFRAHFNSAVTATMQLDDTCIERSILNNGDPIDPASLAAISDSDIAHAEVIDGEALIVFKDKVSSLRSLASAMDTGIIHYCSIADFIGTLVGLYDSGGCLAGLGIIESIDFTRREIYVFTPASHFDMIQFGSIKLDKASYGYAGPFQISTYRHKH